MKGRVDEPTVRCPVVGAPDDPAWWVGGVGADASERESATVEDSIVPASLNQHGVLVRGLIELECGGHAALGQV